MNRSVEIVQPGSVVTASERLRQLNTMLYCTMPESTYVEACMGLAPEIDDFCTLSPLQVIPVGKSAMAAA
eukprot:6184735-Pleurochrysis_carterae.AAC.2